MYSTVRCSSCLALGIIALSQRFFLLRLLGVWIVHVNFCLSLLGPSETNQYGGGMPGREVGQGTGLGKAAQDDVE